MPTDASIPLAVQTPAPYDPLAAYSRVAQLQSALQGQQVQQAQLTGLNQENQMRQVQIQDQQTLRQAFADSNGDPDQLFKLATQRGVSPGTLLQLKNSLLDMKTKAATLDKDTLANTQNRNDQLQSLIAPVANESDPVKQQAEWNNALGQAISKGLLQPQEAAQHTYPGPDGVKSYAASLNLEKWTLSQQQQGIANKNSAEIPGAQANSEIAQLKADAQKKAVADFQANPQAGGQIIDRVLPTSLDASANASYKAAWQSAMQNGGPDAAQKIVEAAAAHGAEISKATNPAIRQANVQQSVDTETATAPIKVNEQVQAELQKAKLAPGAFSSVVDPADRTRAIADFQKSSDDYADKIGAARQLQDFVAAAQSGNKVAPGLIPIAEVKQLLNRVNRNELQSVSSSAGNAYDRLQGFFNKWKDGQPIPTEVLKDTATIGNVMANAAQRTYENKVAINRQVYGSNAQPITLSGNPGSAAVPPAVQNVLKSAGPGIHKLSDGSQWMKAADGTISKP